MKRRLLFLIWGVVLALLSQTAIAQSFTIHGKVTSTENIGLSGVSVHLNGLASEKITDEDGYFDISIPKLGSTIIFSYTGKITQTVQVQSADSLYVQLKDSISDLNEVIVIGYGTQKKANVTGAISSVKAADLEGMPVMRVEQSMQGRTSGITIASGSGQPGSAATVRIRGTTSINNSDPLYVVDGVQVDVGGIDYLDQNDIESIQVLKDAASAAIYGTRAANGVILITTKKGMIGATHIGYNTYYGLQKPDRKLDLLDATQYTTLRNEANTNDGNNPVYANPSTYGKGTDWQSLIFNNRAPIQDHQLTFSGGNNKSTFFSSFGYFDQKGIVLPEISWYKRFTMRLNSTHKVTPWLTFGQNLSYTYIKNQGIGNVNSEFGGPLSSAINLDPTTPSVITDAATLASQPYANLIQNYPDAVLRNANGDVYGISTTVQQEITNPLAYASTQRGNYNWAHNIVGNAYLEIKPLKGLTLRTSIGGKQSFYGSQSFTPIYYLNASTSNLSSANLYRDNEKGLLWNFDNTISYNFNIHQHNFSAMVGSSAQQISGDGVNGTFQGLPTNDYTQASPNFSLASDQRIAGGYDNQPYKLASLFGRLTYDYQGKYLLTGIIRRDGSSKFGSNNRYGVFPSVSMGWVASNEDFWHWTNTISYLKIRGSYGITGNDQSLSTFQYVSTIGSGANYPIGTGNSVAIGYLPNAPANPDLKWEQTSQLDFGFDATVMHDFSITLDWFQKKTSGMLLQVQLPGYIGATGNPYGNIADLKNHGLELELGYNKQLGEVGIKANANVSYIKNVITNIGTNSYLTGASVQNSTYEISRTTVGQPIGAFYGFKTLGIFQTQTDIDNYVNSNGQKIQPNAKPGDFKWADLNGDGSIGSDDRTFLGNPTPTWTYGATLAANWKNFDIVVFGQGAGGNKIFQALRRLDITSANWTTDALGRWTGEGSSNDHPRLTNDDPNNNYRYPSSYYLSSGTYFRIKNAQIGYSIPKKIIGKAGFQKFRIYFAVNNLATFTKYKGYDPEIGGSSYGIDRGIYPQAKSFMFGANINF